jgi:hypothetical protein
MKRSLKVNGYLDRFLPRSESKAVFIFALTCYDIAISVVTLRLLRLFGWWPMTIATPAVPPRPVDLGVADSTIWDFLWTPIVESALLIGVIELLRYLKCGAWVQVIVSTVLICALHSLQQPAIWGLAVLPGFLINTGAFVYWRKTSFWTGAQVMVILHFCSNILPILVVTRRMLH